MLETLATRGVYAATGWLAVPNGPELVGITVGLLLLTYVVWGTLRRKLSACLGSPQGVDRGIRPPAAAVLTYHRR